MDCLVFGIIDIWFVWNLIGGEVFFIDVINVFWILLFNIEDGVWDVEILNLFDIFEGILLDVKLCVVDFGVIIKKVIGKEILIFGVVGD